MSHAMKFSGPFIKNLYASRYGDNRQQNNPLSGISDLYNQTVPSPHRRVYLLIQNLDTQTAYLTFNPQDNANQAGGGGYLQLAAGQTISFDNYNGPIYLNGASPNMVMIVEAFA